MMKQHERGGVSIFIVIFTALLLTVATTSFVQLMIRNQQQATTSDLSQSAYDAALAGVEDAKRALVMLAKCENNTDPSCSDLREQFNSNSQRCEFLGDGGVGLVDFGSSHEVTVGDVALNQAYTCVKINTDNEDHRGFLSGDSGSQMIRLQSKSNFNRVKISWFSNDDLTKDNLNATLGFPISIDPSNPFPLLPKADWNADIATKKIPPMLRAQLIQYKRGEIELNKLKENARTTFLYPVESAAEALDADWSEGNPRNALCDETADAKGYHCHAEFTIPDLADDNASVGNREVYLQLAAIYSQAHFSVELLDEDDDLVKFSGGQATVDSTGRAANLFRRVSARVSVKSAPLKYPEAALSVNGNLCKNFFVTNNSSDWRKECDP